MKTKSRICSILAAVVLLPVVESRAADVSISVFYDGLEPYGDWMEVADYGYCWHPRDAGADWQPYRNGNWVYTDAGWTWNSDEPYGWAVYHYGRWARLDRIGWVWVPDTEWAPAWVSWRRSDRYVGWAPLPPESRIRVGVSFGNWVDSYYDIGPANYSFIGVRDFGAPHLAAVIIPPRENITIIDQTTNITNITYRNNVVINEGPDYAVVSRESAQPVRRLRLERREDVGDLRTAKFDQFRTQVKGDALVVAAPAVEKATADARPKKVSQRVDQKAIDRGWKSAGDAKQVEATRAKIHSEAKVPDGLPPSRVAGEQKTPDREPARPADGQKPDQPATAKRPPEPDRGKTATGSNVPGYQPPARAEELPEQRAKSIAEERDRAEKKQRGKTPQKRPEAIAEDLNPPTDRPERTPRKPEAPGRMERPERPQPQQPREQKIQRSERPERLPEVEPPQRPERAKPRGEMPEGRKQQHREKLDRPEARELPQATEGRHGKGEAAPKGQPREKEEKKDRE